MKKPFLFAGLIFLAITVMAQKSWVGFTSDKAQLPEITIFDQNENHLILEVVINGMYVSEVSHSEETYQRLEILPFRTTKEIGRPELPILSEVIGIPNNKTIQVEILEQESIQLLNYSIYPFQTPTTDNPGGFDKDFVMDRDFYKQAKDFPGKQVYIDRKGIWRDINIANLHIVPFKYNPSNKNLEAITSIKLKLTFSGNDPQFSYFKSNSVSPLFYNLYESKIINFESLGITSNSKGNSDTRYLIITNPEAVSTIQPFVDWKNQQGFKVEVRTLESGFNSPQEFKDYISTLYASDGLEYVLMVGDAYPNGGSGGGDNIVPMYLWAPPGEAESFSDSWYTCMDGSDDHYADLAIGRITYDNLSELSLQIQKTMDHYLTPDEATNWAENTILVAHKENYPQKYTACCEEIRNFDYTLQTPIFEQAYGGAGYTNTEVVNYVNNNSCGIFNYRGHGSATELWEWGPSGSFTAQHVNQLTNEDRLFVFFDVCCDNMDIVEHAGDCLCESFMKSDVGAVATNGAIIPSYTIPNHDYDKEMYKAVFEDGIYNIGYITNYANITVLDVHGDIGRSNVRTYLWLGDASIEPWTLQPQNLIVSHDEELFLGLSTFTVNVIGNGGPSVNALVCVTNEDQSVYALAYTDESGAAEIVFDAPLQEAGIAKVTVTVHNHLPYQTDIVIIPQDGPYVVKESYTLNDVTGNNNGMMDYGEDIMLSLAIKNVGIQQATDVSVALSTEDSYITFTDNSEVYGNINPDEVLEISDAFAFEVANDIPDGHFVLINVEATGSSDETWNSSFSIEGHAPVLQLGDISISDPSGNNNGKIDPGETVDILVYCENTGSADALNLTAELLVSDTYVTINSSEVNYGNLLAGEMSGGVFSVTAEQDTPAGHMVDFTFDVEANLGISGSGVFTVIIGQIPVLILNLDGGTSANKMEQSLSNTDIAYETLSAFPENLNLYSSIFVCLGIYANNYTLNPMEGDLLADFLNSGGALYMEGGDTWAYDDQTAVHELFNINGADDGDDDMTTVLGQTNTFTDGMTFSYSGANSWMDHIEPIENAFYLFKNNSPSYGTGIAYDGGTYKTIGTSHEFGGLDDGTFPSTKEELMYQYLSFFGLMQGGALNADFDASQTDICMDDVVVFNDLTFGVPSSWLWTFEGGDPETSNEQNPTVTYSTEGSYDVTLEVSDGTNFNTIAKQDYIAVSTTTPDTPGTPDGESDACTNIYLAYEYTIGNVANASSYEWILSPAEAGSISGTGTTGTVTWTANWTGLASVQAKAMNGCGASGFSDDFEVMCSICTGIAENINENNLKIFPNPNTGLFTFELSGFNKEVILKIYSALGNEIYQSEKLEVNGNFSQTMDLNLKDGVYYLRILGENIMINKKLIIRK